MICFFFFFPPFRLCELWQSRFIPGGHSVNEWFSDRNETTEGSTETIQKWQQAILSDFALKWTWFENVFLVSWVWHWKSSNACPTLNPLLLFLHSCLPFLRIFFLRNITKKRKSNMQNWDCSAKLFQIVRLHVLDLYFLPFWCHVNLLLCTNHSSKDVAQWKPVTDCSQFQSLSPSQSCSCRFTGCVYTIDSNRILG